MVVANQLDTTYQTYTIGLPQSFSLLMSNSHQYYKTNSKKIRNCSVLSKSVTENLYTTIQRAENIGSYFVGAMSTDIIDIQHPRLWKLKHDVCVWPQLLCVRQDITWFHHKRITQIEILGVKSIRAAWLRHWTEQTTYRTKRSGCAKKSANISSKDLRSRIKVGSTIFVRSIPIRTCRNDICSVWMIISKIHLPSEVMRKNGLCGWSFVKYTFNGLGLISKTLSVIHRFFKKI